MKYWRYRLIEFVMWLFIMVFATTLLWIITKDAFGLSWGKAEVIVIGSYIVWQANVAAEHTSKEITRAINNDKFAEALKDEVDKTLAANTEEAKLAEYRRTFGQSGKK